MIALGYSTSGSLNDIEVIDLSSPSTTCQTVQSWPYRNHYSQGFLGFDNEPVICGGSANNSICLFHDKNDWVSFSSLNTGRYGHAVASFYNDTDKVVLVTGGYNGSRLSSTEILSSNGWKEYLPLPKAITYHCIVQVNETYAMVTGGVAVDSNNTALSATYYFNIQSQLWSDGPSLKKSRYRHSCSKIKSDFQSQEESLIVMGGSNLSSHLNSVELLKINSLEWEKGPDLPLAVHGAVAVQDPAGGVILIGGYGDDFLNTLYKLPHAGPSATWLLMSQQLRIPRYRHTAFLISDEYANCTQVG